MGKIHIEKGSVQETLIIPLYGRKLCAEQFPTLYQDEYAAKICESIDYDFRSLKAKKAVPCISLAHWKELCVKKICSGRLRII